MSQISIRLPLDIHAKLTMAAKAEGIPPSTAARQLIQKALEEQAEQERLAGLEARLVAHLNTLQQSINSLVQES